MKKNLFLFTITVFLLLASCSKAEDDSTTDDSKNTISQSDIIGVWKSGDYFVSFSSNNYYIAYLSDIFIDSGNYTISENVITCQNNYLAKTTTINIKVENNNQLTCQFTYTDGEGINKTINITFDKSADSPTQSNHVIIGKSDTWKISWGNGGYSDVIGKYTTSNGGYEEILTGNLKGVKRDVYYIYLHPFIYYQRYRSEDHSHGSNTFNKDILSISKKTVTINSNGSISFQ